MYKSYRSISALLLLVSLSSIASAQNTNSATPDAKMIGSGASGAGMGGLYTPNLYNGTLDINVPVYAYANFGISLTYNTLGVKVDEAATEISTHWNLQAEPTLVRVVHDLPDEYAHEFDSLLYGMNDSFIINEEHFMKGKLYTYTETALDRAVPNVYRDGECDEFIFSGAGATFSFFIGSDFKVFTNPHRNIQVSFFADGVPLTDFKSLGSHKLELLIRDEQGNQYYFEPGDRQYMVLQGFSDWQHAGHDGENSLYYTSRWVPQMITLADGKEIRYTHTGEFTGYDMVPPYSDYRNYAVRENGGFCLFYNYSENHYGYYTQLSEIQYPNGVKATFVADANEKSEKGAAMLNEIKIASDINCQRYKFYRDTVNGRWFLDKVTMLSCDGQVEEPYYTFEYNSLYLPRRLNSAQDFFGYYNGDSIGNAITAAQPEHDYQKRMTIPQHQGLNNYGSERQYNPSFAQAGLLTRIKNAYGGESDFYYGMNTATGQLSGLPTDNKFVGTAAMDGVRIDSIITKDKYHPDNNVTTTYTYSGGQFFLTGGYFDYPEYIDSITGNWTQDMFQSMFLTAHQLVNGANHGYSGVSVKTYSGGSLLSRSEFTFTNMKDATSDNQPRYYKVPGSKDFYQYPYTDKQYLKDWEMGLPLTVATYDQNNRILEKTINKYRFSAVDLSAAGYISSVKTAKVNSGQQLDVLGLSPTTFPVGYYCPYKIVFTDTYYPFTGTALPDTSISLKYVADNSYVADTVVYEYDDHNNVKSTVTQTSKNEKITTELVYNYDVDGPDMPSGYTEHPGTTLYDMTADGLEQVVSTERWKLNTSGQPDALLDAYITVFNYEDNKLWTKGLLSTLNGMPLTYTGYTSITYGGPGNPYGNILDAYNTTTPIPNFRRTSEVTLFDLRGNPEETRMLDQNQYKTMIWDTATGRKLADAANCRYTDIAYTSFESSLYGSNLSLTQASYVPQGISGSNAARLWTASSPGAAISVNGTQNLTAGKEYILSFWVKGPAPTAYIGTTTISLGTAAYTSGDWKQYILYFTPATAAKIKITGGGPLSYIDEVRLYPSGAQMQSRTYTPLYGISSQTDASGRITYYQYDPMGRNVIVRDQEGTIVSKTVYHIGQ